MSDSLAPAAVIDLFSPEPKRKAASPPPPAARATVARSAQRHQASPKRRANAAAPAPPNDEIIELLSDDEDDAKPPAAPLHQAFFPPQHRPRKRQREGMGRLKDYGEDGRKREARDDNNPTINRADNHVIDLFSNDSPPAAAMQNTTQVKVSPEFQVLEVFPDADMEDVKNLLRRYNDKVEVVVALMFEKGYEKTSVKSAPLQQQGVSVSAQESAKWTCDFMASDSFTPSSSYVKQAKAQLLYDFVFLSNAGVDAILQRNGHHYAKAHDSVVTALKGTGDDETKYRRVDVVLRGSMPAPDQAERLNACQQKKVGAILKRKSSRKRMVPRVTDPILQEEMRYAQGKLQDFMDIGRKHDSMEKKQKLAKAMGVAMDCSCCYDGYDIDDMVACTREGHLFCVGCLKQYAESQIFGVGNLGVDRETKKPAHELKCFHGDCSSGFDRPTLEKALPERTLKKYDEIQFNISLQAAGLANMVTCPKCEFQAELPYDQKFLVCPVDTCKYESCRECGEAAHVGIR